MSFTSAQAIRAGLLTELMTVVVQPPPSDLPIIPTKFTGTYQFSEVRNTSGKFIGYELKINQDYLSADSISGYFENTEEILIFCDNLKNAGVRIRLEDDFSGHVTKYSAKEAKDERLIFAVRYGKTSVQGSFEISEGVATIKQKPFKLGKKFDKIGAFKTASDLFTFIKECFEDLKFFDEVKRMFSRQGYALKNNEDYSERSLERNRDFQGNPEKYLQRLENQRSRFFSSRMFQFGKR